jgi:hypothetical protein
MRDECHVQMVKDSWNKHKGPLHQKLTSTLNFLHKWGNSRFGITPKRIKAIQDDLNLLNNINGQNELASQIHDKEKELDDLLESEELWWGQRSRALWLQHGDKNTKFFHMKANQRRKKNKIDSISDSNGQLQYEEDKIEQIFVDQFQNLFSSRETFNIPEIVEVVKGRITADMHQHLSEEFTKEEVYCAIKDMKALAAPGPDGLPALFYHNYWDIIGKDVTAIALDVLNNNGDPRNYNSTHICLIPKTTSPLSPVTIGLLPFAMSPKKSSLKP